MESVSAVWEMGRAGCLRHFGDLGKMSVTCVDGHSSTRTRSPSHCVPRPLHFSMFCVAVTACQKLPQLEATPSRGKDQAMRVLT